MITIRDVARQAGVSVATVSRVLNNSALVSPETRETVMKAVTQLGYRPNANAQALATQVSDTIGVVVMDVSDAFFGALVKAVDMVAQQHEKYVLIGNSYHEAEKERHAIEVLAEVDEISFNFFHSEDVVRHPVVARIVNAYEAWEAADQKRKAELAAERKREAQEQEQK